MTQPELMRHSQPQGVMPQSFLGPSTPSQPHNLNLLSGANPGMNFMQNTHPSNGPFTHPGLARIQSDTRQRQFHIQSQRATSGGAQTGPPVMNGVVSAQPSGLGYPGMAPQSGQGLAHRIVSQPGGVGGPVTTSHPHPHPHLHPHPHPHPTNINNHGLNLTSGLQTQRSAPQPQPQSQMGMRPGQPSLPGQPSVGPLRPPPVTMPGIPAGGMRSSSGIGVNITSGPISNVPQQTQPQQGFPGGLTMGGPGAQPPPQGPQGPANSMSQMHRTITTPDGTNPFGGMQGFPGGPFPQPGTHPPVNHIAGSNPANQPFSFMPASSPPSQPTDMGHSGSGGGGGSSSTSPPRSDFTMTPAQMASLQYGPGTPSGTGGSSTNESIHSTFTTMPPQRPSSSHSALSLAHQRAPTPQGLSHPTPPRQQTPLQQAQISQGHVADRTNPPIANPTRPQSQPQRPSSQQQMRRSLTPRNVPGTLPPNATLLQAHPASIGGGSTAPPQPRPNVGTSGVTGPPPLVSASSTENGDLSRQPGVASIRPSMPGLAAAIGLGQALTRILLFSGVLAAEDQRAQKSQLSHWENLVDEFFSPTATLKLTLWKDNQRVEAKVFEVGTPVLPRFFLVTSQSGVKSMTLSLDGARERVVGSNQAIVQCVSAMWTYRYHNGYIVTLRGPFTAYVSVIPNATQNGAPAQSVPPSGFTLKIDHIQFDSNVYEKHVAVDVIGGNRLDSNKTPQVRNGPTPSPTMNGAAGPPPPLPPPHPPQPPPPQAGQRDEGGWEDHRITYERAYIPTEPVNAFGIPQATMRCLELAESVAQMTDLMHYSHVKHVGPLDTLKQFVQHIREMPPHAQGQYLPEGMGAGPSTHSLYTPTLASTAPSSAQITPATIPQGAASASSPSLSPDKAKGTPQQTNAPNPNASAPAGSSTPSIQNAQLKRKGGETNSPTTANAEQSTAGKRNPRKRGRTTGGN